MKQLIQDNFVQDVKGGDDASLFAQFSAEKTPKPLSVKDVEDRLDPGFLTKLRGQYGGATNWSSVFMVAGAVKDQGASRKILQRPLPLDSRLPNSIHLLCEQVEQKVMVVPSLVGDGHGVVPCSPLRQGDVALKLCLTGRWEQGGSAADIAAGVQIMFQKPGDGGGTALTLIQAVSAERNVAAHLHIFEQVPEMNEMQPLVMLEPVWVFSTSSNPILQLVCPKTVKAFEGELAVVGLIPAKEGRYLATPPVGIGL